VHRPEDSAEDDVSDEVISDLRASILATNYHTGREEFVSSFEVGSEEWIARDCAAASAAHLADKSQNEVKSILD